MHLIEGFVRHPVKVVVGVLLVVLFGTLAIARMPMQLTPEVEIPTITIQTTWPGASPAEVESEIIQEQEEQLQSVEGVTKMTSESMDSMGRIVLEFAVGTDMGEALTLTDTRLNQVRSYPENVDKPVITASNSANQFIAWFILNARAPSSEAVLAFAKDHPDLAEPLGKIARTQNVGLAVYRLRKLAQTHPELRPLLPSDMDITTLRRFAKNFIESRFENVAGVSDSNVFGGREEELQVVVDPQRLAARRLTIDDVRQALRARNLDTSAGDFWEGKRRYVVRTIGKFREPAEVEDVLLARVGEEPIYIKDVAEVRLGYKKPDGMVRRYGESVIAVNATRKTGANVLDVMAGLRRAADELDSTILAEQGLQLRQVYDETEYIYSSIDLVNENILEGAVLTLITLLVFLRSFRSTLVIFVSIAVSMVGMFLLMNLMGRSLNVLSLAGIAFAVGMLVDNFIVVLGNIYRHYQSGDDPLAATVNGTSEVWGAVLASTLANLAVFIPVLFVQDQAGQLFRDIALAAASALVCSLLVALILVPTAAGHILTDPGLSEARGSTNQGDPQVGRRRGWRRWGDQFGRVFGFLMRPVDAFGRAFVRVVVGINAWLQGHVFRQLAVVCLLIGASLILSWLLMPKREYLPTGNQNLVFGILIPPPGYNLDQLKFMGERIEQRLEKYWDVDATESDMLAQLDYPAIHDFFYVARGRQLFMGVRAQDPLRAGDLIPLLQRATADLPGVIAIVSQRSLFEQGLTAGRTIDVDITGPDIHRLVALGGQVMGGVMENVKVEVAGKPVLSQARPTPSLDLSSPEMHIVPKWRQAADMGVNATELGYAIDALVDGAYAGDYFTGGDKIDLTILGQEHQASRTHDLSALSLATPRGELISLSALADVQYASGPEQINHRRRQRSITIQVSPPEAMPLEAAMDVIRAKIVEPLSKAGQLDGGYQIVLSGTADKLADTWRVLGWNLALAILITYLLMAALFESWLYPFVIMLSVPLGAVGGFAGLWLLNFFHLQTLDVMTMLGFIILVGTVVNNPILIVEQALVHIRDEGMDPQRAVLESVRTRIRPIFMTAMIGLFGLLPLVISPGAGSELYRGMGSVLLGGLLVSTVFTLILVPTLFSLAFELRSGVVRLWRQAPASPPRMRVPELAAKPAAATAATAATAGQLPFDDSTDETSTWPPTVPENGVATLAENGDSANEHGASVPAAATGANGDPHAREPADKRQSAQH